MARRIAVTGVTGTHPVIENLDYNHTVGRYAKAVMIDGVERIVSSPSARGPWSLNRPLVDVAGIIRTIRTQDMPSEHE